MMRNTVTLALIWTFVLCASHFVAAQGVSVAGDDVLKLAKTIIKQANINHTLPAAYIMRVGDKSDAIITAPMALEILNMTLSLRQKSTTFPKTITGLSLLYKPYDPASEPPPDQRRDIAIWTSHFLNQLVPSTLEIINTMQNTIPKMFTLKENGKITAAEYVLAMATVIKEWGESGMVSDLINIPAISSPTDWTDISNPIPVYLPATLHVLVNGINVQRKANDTAIPDALNQPFCGVIQVNLISGGPVKSLQLDLDGQRQGSFDRAGSYGCAIDTIQLTDGTHQLTFTLTDEDGKSFSSTLPLQVQNGRMSSFTPAEIENPETTVSNNG